MGDRRLMWLPLLGCRVQSVTAQYDVEYATHLSIVTKMYTNYLLAMLEWPDVSR